MFASFSNPSIIFSKSLPVVALKEFVTDLEAQYMSSINAA